MPARDAHNESLAYCLKSVNSAIAEYALSSARATRLLGAETLVTPLLTSPIEERLKTSGVDVAGVAHFGPGKYPALSKIASKFDPDLIITYGGPETTAALLLKGRAKLIRFHGYKNEQNNPVASLARSLGHLHVDQVIAPSDFVASCLRSAFAPPVSILTLGCDTEVFNFKEITRGDRPEILIFGRLDPVKGHREFLHVFRQILAIAEKNSGPRPKLRVVGLPANLSSVHILAEAKKIGVDPHDLEINCQKVSNVAELMSKASLGVVSSLGSEVICRVAQEFLLCGTPVATTTIGSLPEVLVKEYFGTTFDNKSGDQAAERIYETLMSSFAEDTSTRKKRAEDARIFFSIDAMAKSLELILKS